MSKYTAEGYLVKEISSDYYNIYWMMDVLVRKGFGCVKKIYTDHSGLAYFNGEEDYRLFQSIITHDVGFENRF